MALSRWNSYNVNKYTLLALSILLLASHSASRAVEPGQKPIMRTIKVGELNRAYCLHVPLNLPKDKAVPLVLLFHGGGGTPAQIDKETKFGEAATRQGFLVACPDGVRKRWNDGRDAGNVPAQRYNINDLAFVEAVLNDVAGNYKLDQKRVFATGISNGAIFSQYLAVKLSSRIAAIAPVAGGLPDTLSADFNPEKPVAVLMFNGTDDSFVPYTGGKITVFRMKNRGAVISTNGTVQKWIGRDGCNSEPITEEMPDTDPGDGCRVKKFTYAKGKDGTEVALYQIEGGGHTWPGVTPTLPKFIVGKVCRDINATAIILEFFKAHPKP